MSAIVTNAKNRIAYNVVRSLGLKGIDVYTADSIPRAMSFASRYSTGHFIYPSPYSEPEAFIQCVIEESRLLRADVLIPVFEETFLLAKYAERLAGCVSMALPSYEKILIAHNKDRWAQVARNLGIPVPESHSMEDLLSGTIKPKDLRYPVLLKPKQGGGAWGIQQLDSPAEIERLLRLENCNGIPWHRFFVQEKVAGETHCIAMLMNHGMIRGKVAYRQLRDYPATGGQATLRISVRSHKAEAYLQQVLESLDWHGVCQADFMVDHSTQIPYLIDLNPRLWGSLAQSIASGVDFPYLIYRLAKDGDVSPVTDFQTGVVTRWIGGELGAFIPHLKRAPERREFLRSFFFPPTPAALYDDFSLSDPLPFLAWLLDALLKAVKFRSLKAVSHEMLNGVWE